MAQSTPIALCAKAFLSSYLLAAACVKVSVLLFYRRITRRSSRTCLRWSNSALLAFVVVSTTVFYCIGVFHCRPIEAAWLRRRIVPTPYEEKHTCLPDFVAAGLPSIVSVLTDFLIAAFPLLFVPQLQLPRKQKWCLMAILSLGFLCVSFPIL